MKVWTVSAATIWVAAMAWTLREYSREMPSFVEGQVVASLSSSSGDVLIREPMASGWIPGKNDHSLVMGTAVSTGRNSRASIRLQNGRVLKMEAESQLLLEFAAAQDDPIVTVVEGSFTLEKSQSDNKKSVLGRVLGNVANIVGSDDKKITVYSGDKELVFDGSKEENLDQPIAAPTAVAENTPEPTPVATPVATPTPVLKSAKEIKSDRLKELDGWVLDFPREASSLWHFEQPGKTPVLRARYSRRRGVGADSVPPELMISVNGKLLRRAQPVLSNAKQLEYSIPTGNLFQGDNSRVAVEFRLADSKTNPNAVVGARRGSFSLNVVSRLRGVAYEVGLNSWTGGARPKGWLEASDGAKPLAQKLILRSPEALAKLMSLGKISPPFLVKTLDSFPNSGAFLVSKGDVVGGLEPKDVSSEFKSTIPTLLEADLIFEGAEKSLLRGLDVESLLASKLPASLTPVDLLFGYNGDDSLRLRTDMARRAPGLMANLAKRSRHVFAGVPNVLWDAKLNRSPKYDVSATPPSFGTVKPVGGLIRMTYLVIRKDKTVEFPEFKDIGLGGRTFLVPADSGEIRLNFSVNGAKSDVVLRREPRKVFLMLERMVKTQLLAVFFEEENGYHVTTVARGSSGAVEERIKDFKGGFPMTWFEDILGYNSIVAARSGAWLVSRNEAKACVPGTQGVVVERPGNYAFIRKEIPDTAKALVECVHSAKGNNFYKVVMGSQEIVAAGVRALLPE